MQTRWFQVPKNKRGMQNWDRFTLAVLAKFGADEYPKAMRGLLGLRQIGSLDEFVQAFDDAYYMTSVHNPELGEVFFVSQFIKGLKYELQGVVQAQLPTTVDRAVLLAQMQQEMTEKLKRKASKAGFSSKPTPLGVKGDSKQGGTITELSKER
jgi:hypothetical protein